ncbi:hypothetical protein P43SY_008975 [Pythium insidiosum]|uniref:Uncharacterized protein n=1 Tax=Pythium insidiosum TaxID=114742 RepID=A0AAD5MAY4_PYTIN|nr:hypothetical protein P43SY_008975 [Pythium insidiosum]
MPPPQLTRRLEALDACVRQWSAQISAVVRLRVVTSPLDVSCTSLRLVLRDDPRSTALPSVWRPSNDGKDPKVGDDPNQPPDAASLTAVLAELVELLALAASTREPVVWHTLLRVLLDSTAPRFEAPAVRCANPSATCSLLSCAFCDGSDCAVDLALEIDLANTDWVSEPRVVHDMLFEREQHLTAAGVAARDALVTWQGASSRVQRPALLRCRVQLEGMWLDDRDTLDDVRQRQYADDLDELLGQITALDEQDASVHVRVLGLEIAALLRQNRWPGLPRVLDAMASSTFPVPATGWSLSVAAGSHSFSLARVEELRLTNASDQIPELFQALANGHAPRMKTLMLAADRTFWTGAQGRRNAEAFGFAVWSPSSRLRLEQLEIWLDRLSPEAVAAIAQGAQVERAQPTSAADRALQSLQSIRIRVDWRSDERAVLGLLQLGLGPGTRAVELEKDTSDAPSSYLAAVMSSCPELEELTCRCRWREAEALEGPFFLHRLKTLRLLRRDESEDLWPADWDADSAQGESQVDLAVLRAVLTSSSSACLRELVWIPEDGIRGETAAHEIARSCPSLEKLVVRGVSVPFVDALAAAYEQGRLRASSLAVYQWMDSYDPETGCCVPIQRLLSVLANDAHAMATALSDLEIGVSQRNGCLDPFLSRLLQRNQRLVRCRFSLDVLGTSLPEGVDVVQRRVELSRAHRLAFLSALRDCKLHFPPEVVHLCWQYCGRVPSRRVLVDLTGGY